MTYTMRSSIQGSLFKQRELNASNAVARLNENILVKTRLTELVLVDGIAYTLREVLGSIQDRVITKRFVKRYLMIP